MVQELVVMPSANISRLLPWVRSDIIQSLVEFFQCDCSRAGGTFSDNDVFDEQVCSCFDESFTLESP